MAHDRAGAVAPTEWALASLSGAPVVDKRVTALVPAHVRRWTGISAEIDQAALNQHFMSIHLGGAKRLYRRGEGSMLTCDVPNAAYSIVPAGAAFEWNTIGPVDFAHIYFEPSSIDHVIMHAFDRDPASVVVQDRLGAIDSLTSNLALALLDELENEDVQKPYLDDILHLLVCRMLKLHSNAAVAPRSTRDALAPFRLRRALDFIEENLGEAIGVAEIAAASGISAFHFSRAFRQATGLPPYAYVLDRRIAKAKLLLTRDQGKLVEIVDRCGFSSVSQFSRMFRKVTGTTPSNFRDRR